MFHCTHEEEEHDINFVLESYSWTDYACMWSIPQSPIDIRALNTIEHTHIIGIILVESPTTFPQSQCIANDAWCIFFLFHESWNWMNFFVGFEVHDHDVIAIIHRLGVVHWVSAATMCTPLCPPRDSPPNDCQSHKHFAWLWHGMGGVGWGGCPSLGWQGRPCMATLTHGVLKN